MVKQRRLRKMQYNDVLNNLIEVAAEHTEMTEEIMYKTCVQFFTDGYDSAAQETTLFGERKSNILLLIYRRLGFFFTI